MDKRNGRRRPCLWERVVRVSDVLQVCARRWYLVVVGLLLTAAACAVLYLSPGVYFARTQVIFLGPVLPASPNKLSSSSDGLISTAGLIEREMNSARRRIPATSIDVTLLDQGVYDGERVTLPNNGGQWATNFNQPLLDLQASGPNAETVSQRIDSMVGEIQAILDRRQDAAGVKPDNRITITVSPAQPQVHYIRGDRRRAVVVAGAIGGAITILGVVTMDQAIKTRWRRVDSAGNSRQEIVA